MYGGVVSVDEGMLIKSLRLLGIGLLGLLGQASLWFLWQVAPALVWFPLAFGVVAVGLGGALVTGAWFGVRWLASGLDFSALRVVALLVAVNAAGVTLGLGGWVDCYHQGDLLRIWSLPVVIGAALVAVAGMVVARPGWAAAVLVVPVLIVAFGTYSWMVNETAATRCAGYQPGPGPSTPPMPPVSVGDSGGSTTILQPGMGSTTTGPPPISPTTIAPTVSGG